MNGNADEAGVEPSGEGTDEDRAILRLIDYLGDLHAARSKPIHDYRNYGIFALREGDVPETPHVRVKAEAADWLVVDFLDYPARPEVSQAVATLLEGGIAFDPSQAPTLRLAPDSTDLSDGEVNAWLIAAEAAEKWIEEVWRPWSKRYLEAGAVKALYRQLFEQRERLTLDPDGVELVWGFGHLEWSTTDGVTVNHPILTVPMRVELAQTDELIVRPADVADLEVSFLATLDVHDRDGLSRQRTAIEAAEPDVWSEELLEICRRFVRSVHPDGAIRGEAYASDGAPSADTGWVLFARRRSYDYRAFLDRMRELYREQDPPLALAATVREAADSRIDTPNPADPFAPAPSEPALLPLATNEAQERIVELAHHHAGVVVQGPPGTGKSHTIANLISHNVAYGRRVLVVAEKEQALTVLSTKLPEEIRDLAAVVLGGDRGSQRGLESSIRAIEAHVGQLLPDEADRKIASREVALDDNARMIARTQELLLQARQREATCLAGDWRAGRDPTPTLIGSWLADHEDTLGYIPDAVALASPVPLARDQFDRFLELLRSVGLERAQAAGFVLPELDRLPDDAALAGDFQRLSMLRAELESAPEIVDWDRIDAAGDRTAEVRRFVERELEVQRLASQGWLGLVADEQRDPLLRESWEEFARSMAAEREQLIVLRRATAAHTVETPPATLLLVGQLAEAERQLRQDGKLGFFARQAKRHLGACRVDGHAAVSEEDAKLCVSAVQSDLLSEKLLRRFRNQVARLGGPELSDGDIAMPLGEHLRSLSSVLETPRRHADLASSVTGLGIKSVDFDAASLQRLAAVLDLAELRPTEREIEARHAELARFLANGAGVRDASPLWGQLANAFARRDLAAWASARQKAMDLSSIAVPALELRRLAQAVENAAPIWSRAIVADLAAARAPSDLDAAWEWRRLDCWLAEISAGPSMAELQHRQEDLQGTRRRIITDIVAARAWRGLVDRLGEREREALAGYIRARQRHGKTGGKYAERWRREMRDALQAASSAIPVWIMTTARAMASFQPKQHPPFDLLIIDEASQVGLEMLPILSLAEKVIIVGDNKQTSPENVGLNQQRVFDLLDAHLRDIRGYRTLYDPNSSLYDLATQKFHGKVMLTEHFRCLPDIIAFSSALAYDGRIVPLRDRPPRLGWKAVGTLKVEGGYKSSHQTNPVEAEAIVDLIETLVNDDEYAGMDFGVVSLLGNEQSREISGRLQDRLGPRVVEERRIRCGEAANFQGDERDVVVLSTVVADSPDTPGGRIGAMTDEASIRRINVAASRAKNQMWIAHSIEPDRFPARDPRAELIRHCANPQATNQKLDDLESRCESEFERSVLRLVLARGYRLVHVQYRPGSAALNYRIDIVVEGPDSRLAIECDGEEWHGPETWQADLTRQQILERAGWTFERIRGSTFFRSPDTALEPLWQRLDQLNIPTGDEWMIASSRATTLLSTDLRAYPPELAETLQVDVDDEPDLVPAATAPIPLPRRPIEVRDSRDPQASELGPVHRAAAPIHRRVTAASVDGSPMPGADDHVDQSRVTQPAPANQTLTPYLVWPGAPLPAPEQWEPRRIVDALVECVASEGPMLAKVAYERLVKAGGGQRVGTGLRRTLNSITARAVRSGLLSQIDDGIPGQVNRTLFIPGTAQVSLRALGPRTLYDVPRSEIQELIRHLDVEDEPPDELKRAVLDAYGLRRLTENASTYIDEARRYRRR